MTAPDPTRDPYPRNRATSAFERRIARALRPVVHDGACVVVACSGGPDSLATLIAVTRALDASRVTAAHYDHRLRSVEEARQERAVVEDAASALGVTVRSGRPSRRPVTSAEDAAREARYRWLAGVCHAAGAAVCITGHTLDDQAETVLLRLARGTTATGAAGMGRVAPWPVAAARTAGIRLLRPLLGRTRAEVEAYLVALGVQAARDPSNDTLQYARNRVRRQVLPALREINARAAEHIARFAEQQREDDAALQALARDWLEQHGRRSREAEGPRIALGRRALRALPPAVARRAVWCAASEIGLALEGSHIEAILRSLVRSGASTSLPMGYAVNGATELMLQAQHRR